MEESLLLDRWRDYLITMHVIAERIPVLFPAVLLMSMWICVGCVHLAKVWLRLVVRDVYHTSPLFCILVTLKVW